MLSREDVTEEERQRQADIARALLMMISNNLGQVAYLNALREGCNRIYFAGNFFHHANHVCSRVLIAMHLYALPYMPLLLRLLCEP